MKAGTKGSSCIPSPSLRHALQGFTYASHCVIRNVTKRWAEQEIWREAGTDDAAQALIA